MNVLGVGARIPRKRFNAYIMERTGVGLRESVNRYLTAWEDLGLIEEATWKGSRRQAGHVILTPRPEGLGNWVSIATPVGVAA